MAIDVALAQRLITALSIPEPMSGCWLWLGRQAVGGYGVVEGGAFKQRIRANRLAALAFNLGDIEGKVVCHKCDNPTCVNPNHLFIGTMKDNMQDCARKGRIRLPLVPSKAILPKGRCSSGHSLTGEYYGRSKSGAGRCMACVQIKTYLESKTNRGTGMCEKGHAVIGDNSVLSSGETRCLICWHDKNVNGWRRKVEAREAARLEKEATDGR